MTEPTEDSLDAISSAIERALDDNSTGQVLSVVAGCLVGLVEALAAANGADTSKPMRLDAGPGSRDVTIHERNPIREGRALE